MTATAASVPGRDPMPSIGGRPQRLRSRRPTNLTARRCQRERVGGRCHVERLLDEEADVAQHAQERLNAIGRGQAGAFQGRAGEDGANLRAGQRVAKDLEPPLDDQAAAAVRDHVEPSGRAGQTARDVDGVEERTHRQGRVIEDKHLPLVVAERVRKELHASVGRGELVEQVGRARERPVHEQQRAAAVARLEAARVCHEPGCVGFRFDDSKPAVAGRVQIQVGFPQRAQVLVRLEHGDAHLFQNSRALEASPPTPPHAPAQAAGARRPERPRTSARSGRRRARGARARGSRSRDRRPPARAGAERR